METYSQCQQQGLSQKERLFVLLMAVLLFSLATLVAISHSSSQSNCKKTILVCIVANEEIVITLPYGATLGDALAKAGVVACKNLETLNLEATLYDGDTIILDEKTRF